MAVSFTIKPAPGNDRVLSNLKALPDKLKKNLVVEVDKFLLNVLRDSKTVPPRVPVDTGALQSTGHAEPAEIKEGKVTGSVVYGGFAAAPYNIEVDYAVLVHEDMGRNYRRPGSGPKFVEAHWIKRTDELKQGVDTAFAEASKS